MSQIKNFEQSFKNEVSSYPGGERVLNCYLCGTCTAGCPISEIEAEYNPRRIMRKILLGKREELLNSGEIWKCYQCHTCVAHCPQDVRLADIIRVLRGLAAEEWFAGPELAGKVKEIDLNTRKQRLEQVRNLLSKELF